MNTHRRKGATIIGVSAAAVLLTGGIAYAIDALDVQLPLLPVVGQAAAQPCDADGVNTSFAYGASSRNGVKVNSVTVTGINADCKTTTVEFLTASDAIVSTVSGAVSSNATTISTNIWTNDFSSVRVTVSP